ncbi:MAG: glycosyl hydrolase [Bryobacteraceae bacterium]
MPRLILLLLSALFPSQPSLEESFRNPPLSARPSFYFLLLNGYLNREYLPTELAQYRDAGFGSLTLFDMGARGEKAAQPPAGPEFLSAKSADDIAHVIRTAGKLGMDVDLSVSSSWDMGASWVKPEEASMTLLSSHLDIEGPGSFDVPLPLPALPAETPKGPGGEPLFRKEIATLAIANPRALEGYTFIIQLEPPYPRRIHRVVLFNTNSGEAENYFAKDFVVSVSNTTADTPAFTQVLSAALEPKEGAQAFSFPATQAKYVKLTLKSGHNSRSSKLQLGEFQVWTTAERNVALSHKVNRLVDGADLVRQPSAQGQLGDWAASNIHDNVLSGARGSWASGAAPLRVDKMDEIQDISRHVDAQGRLRWSAPAGRWRVIRYLAVNTGERLKVPSPNSDGLATDHFSEPATVRYINEVVRRLQPAIGDIRKSALKELYLASYEVRGQVWTPRFLEEFRKRRGYDLTPYLPALTGSQIGDEATTERVLYDYRKTQGELLVDNYYRAAVRTAAQAGLGVESEAGGPGPPIHQVPVDALLANSAVTTVRGEFWPYRQNAAAMWVVKETAAAAHIYGKPIVAMEAFTSSYHWYEGPQDLKASADRAFAEGMNHVVWHTASHHPPEAGKPGWVYYAGTHLTPNVVWWPFARPFLDYLARASFLLRQGVPVSDVVHYYGDQGYNFVPPKHVDPGTGYGYDYDVINADAVIRRLTFRNGRLTLPEGTSYAVLALQDREDMDLDVLRKIATLAEQGATIVGPKPRRATGYSGYPGKDAQVREVADLLWGRRLITNRTVRDAMASLRVGPDLRFSGDEAAIDFVHRRTAKEDVYFVRNKTKQWVEGDATFRVSGRHPEIWDAATGSIEARSGNPVHLRLPPDGSTFVVFREGAGKSAPEAKPAAVVSTLEGPWEVHFGPKLGAAERAVFPKLISWTDHTDEGIRYYSGIAEYRKRFTVQGSASRVTLDLGEMWAVAEVSVNGGKPQVVWQRPFEADITADVKPGENELRVRVANNWVNRLVGDARGAGAKIAKTNVTTNSPAGTPWAKVEPRASGLLGPVRVMIR